MKALDITMHLITEKWAESMALFNEARKDYCNYVQILKTEDEIANDLRANSVQALISSWDASTTTGLPPMTPEYVAEIIKKHPDVFIGGIAMIDPWKGKAAIDDVTHAVKDLGMIGIRFHPAIQAFYPNDTQFYPLYEKILEFDVPVQFHTGTTPLGRGAPGGMGVQLKYARPILIDDVAAEFPDLKIVLCYNAWPWQEELLAMLIHKSNIYAEISGEKAKFLSSNMRSTLYGDHHNKIMFSSDYPFSFYKELFGEWDNMGFSAEMLEKIYILNARKVYKI